MELDEMRITEFLAEEIYSENKYISTARGVYQIRYSPAQHQYYPRKLFSGGFAGPGELRLMTAAEVNSALGYKMLREDIT